jgi:hypothetical protein
MKKNLVVFALVITGLVMGGCAKVPQMEIDAVNVSIEKAKVAEADVYLPAEFAAVQDSMNAINAEVEAQKSKMFGSYKDVKVKLAALQVVADELEGKSIAKKEEIKLEVNTIYAEMQTLLAENNALLLKAPKGKEGKVVIEAIKGELTVIEATMAEVPGLLESGNLLGAQAKVKAVQEKATAINAELLAVIEKYTQKRK